MLPDMRNAVRMLGLVAALAEASGCQQTDLALMERAEGLAVSTARPLRVLMYGHIPPYRGGLAHPALAAWLEARFEQHAEQQIDLQLRFGDTYALTPTSPELVGPDGYDVIEIDLAALPPIAAALGPWAGVDPRRLVPAGVAAGQASQGLLWPTYLCSHVIYARDRRIADAHDLADLGRTLRQLARGKPALVGDLYGDGMLSGLYADAWFDRTAGTQPHPSTIEREVVADLRQLVGLCGPSTRDNPCLNDAFDLTKGERTAGIEAMVRGDAAGWLGFSEHAHYALRAGATADTLHVVSAPLGPGTHPALFVDGLARSRRCTGQCQRDATTLAYFLTSAEVQASLALGDDPEAGGIPRYLMLASRAFWERPEVTRDALYAQLRPIAFAPSLLPALEAPEPALRDALTAPAADR
ncbi:MAG: hypothetical protein ABW252_22465 [Polyangiales bacterium]